MMDRVLLLEPFCVESHKLLVEFIEENFQTESFVLPPQKWHWKARTSALYLAQVIPENIRCGSLFTSSVLNLAELLALRPDLGRLKKVVYFHENQLVYPVRKHQDRDFQYGYNQILSCLVADTVVFNSHYNMTSFLEAIPSFLNLIPDHRPKDIAKKIQPKCRVIYLPLPLVESSGCRSLEEPTSRGSTTPKLVTPLTGTLTSSLNKLKRTPQNRENDSSIDSPVMGSGRPDADSNAQPAVAHDCTVLRDLMSSAEDTSSEKLKQRICSAGTGMVESLGCDISKDVSKNNSGTSTQLAESTIAVGMMKLDLEELFPPAQNTGSEDITLHIVWPHRWEHDKNPEMFFAVLFKLQDEGFNFKVSVLGGQFTQVPAIFEEAMIKLNSKICHWGYQEDRGRYYSVLEEAHVVVSTADHEFFGIAMLEAATLGCHPLCPNRLAYPEIFPKSCLYNTQQQLFKKLRDFCRRPWLAHTNIPKIDFGRFSSRELLPRFQEVLSSQPATSLT